MSCGDVVAIQNSSLINAVRPSTSPVAPLGDLQASATDKTYWKAMLARTETLGSVADSTRSQPLSKKDLRDVDESRRTLEKTPEGRAVASEFDWNNVKVVQYRTEESAPVRALRVESLKDSTTPLYLIDSREMKVITGSSKAYAMHDARSEREFAMILPTATTLPVQSFQRSMQDGVAIDTYKLNFPRTYAEFAKHEWFHREEHLIQRDSGIESALKNGMGEISVQVKTALAFPETKTDRDTALSRAAKNAAASMTATHYMESLLGAFGGFPPIDPDRQKFLDLAPGGLEFKSWLADDKFRDALNARAKVRPVNVLDLSQTDLANLQSGRFDYRQASQLTRAVQLGIYDFYLNVARANPTLVAASSGEPAQVITQLTSGHTKNVMGALRGDPQVTLTAANSAS